MKKLLPLLLAVLASCTTTVVDEKLVVEGWIEDGGYPEVNVTSSIVAENGTWKWDELRQHMLNSATVTVSDGENTVQLTSVVSSNHFPPYYFTTTKMKGEAGKTYTLHVSFKGREASAVTTVPAKQDLVSWKVCDTYDGKNILCSFDAKAGSRYKFFEKRDGKDKMYITCYLAMVNGDDTPGATEVTVNRGYDLLSEEYKLSFDPGDKVLLRFCTMGEETYAYWKQYEETVLFSKNPLITVTKPVEGNVTGAYGYWFGYGTSYYTIDIPE